MTDRYIWCLRCRSCYQEKRETEQWLCPECEKRIATNYQKGIEAMERKFTEEDIESSEAERPPMAKSKVEQWDQFSAIVRDHIQNYAEVQYGTFPDKTIAKYTPVKIQAKLEPYVDRIGKGARGEDEALRDALKIGHFACYLYALLTKGDAQADLG